MQNRDVNEQQLDVSGSEAAPRKSTVNTRKSRRGSQESNASTEIERVEKVEAIKFSPPTRGSKEPEQREIVSLTNSAAGSKQVLESDNEHEGNDGVDIDQQEHEQQQIFDLSESDREQVVVTNNNKTASASSSSSKDPMYNIPIRDSNVNGVRMFVQEGNGSGSGGKINKIINHANPAGQQGNVQVSAKNMVSVGSGAHMKSSRVSSPPQIGHGNAGGNGVMSSTVNAGR